MRVDDRTNHRLKYKPPDPPDTVGNEHETNADRQKYWDSLKQYWLDDSADVNLERNEKSVGYRDKGSHHDKHVNGSSGTKSSSGVFEL